MESKYKTINFGQKKGYLIEDEDFIKYLIGKLENKYRVKATFNNDHNHHNNNNHDQREDGRTNGRQINPYQTSNKYYKFLEESDIMLLKKHQHLVCFNLNQKPTYLFLTSYANQQFCIYFGSQIEGFVSVKHRFNEKLYNDTLIEGELVKVSQNHYIYLVSDLLVYNGQINYDPLDKKLQTLQNIFYKNFKSDPGFDVCQILIKEFVKYEQLQSFVNNHLQTTSYQQYVNGIIFRPLVKSNKSIIVVLNKKFHNINIPGKESHIPSYHTQSSTPRPIHTPPPTTNSHTEGLGQSLSQNQNLGIKAPQPIASNHNADSRESEVANVVTSVANISSKVENKNVIKINHKLHTKVHFNIKQTGKPDVYELWLFNGKEPFRYGIASIPSKECSELVKEWFSSAIDSKLIVECEYVKNFNKWKPVKLDGQEMDNILVLV